MKTWDGCWVGFVRDRLTGALVYRSRPVMTWEEAQKRAEKHAKGDRYKVEVVDSACASEE